MGSNVAVDKIFGSSLKQTMNIVNPNLFDVPPGRSFSNYENFKQLTLIYVHESFNRT